MLCHYFAKISGSITPEWGADIKPDSDGVLKGASKVYADNQKKCALKLYDQHKSVTKVIQCLGYPRQALDIRKKFSSQNKGTKEERE